MSMTLLEFALGIQLMSILAIGIVVERHYVSRVTGFTNGIALTVHVLMIQSANPVLYLYAGIGFVLGAVGFAFYTLEMQTGDWYNIPAYFLYSSWNIFWVVILPARLWLVAVLVGIIGQFLIGYFYDAEIVYFDSEPYLVSRTIRKIETELQRQETERRLREMGL